MSQQNGGNGGWGPPPGGYPAPPQQPTYPAPPAVQGVPQGYPPPGQGQAPPGYQRPVQGQGAPPGYRPPVQGPPPGYEQPRQGQTPPEYQQPIAADLPQHARERLAEMRGRRFFTSDLSVNEFLLVKEAGFDPLGMVMGSSIYQIAQVVPPVPYGQPGAEVTTLTQALYHSRYLAMTRMEEEAEALGADGIVGVRLEVNLHAWGQNIAEFIAIGTAIKHRAGGNYRNLHNRPFQSDLSGQDFWTLIRSGYRPVGFVMGNCVYYVPPGTIQPQSTANHELAPYTHALYDARETAVERLQDEAEQLKAEGIVGVTVEEKQHTWGNAAQRDGNAALRTGELIEFFVVGTAVIRIGTDRPAPTTQLIIAVNE